MMDEKTRKLNDLRELILAKAEAERGYSLNNAKKEAHEWLEEQNSRLEQTIKGIIMDAKKRSEEIRRREIMSAEREQERERLRLQNSLLADSINRLEAALDNIRSRNDFLDIMTGIILEGIGSMPPVSRVYIRLSDSDKHIGEKLAERLNKVNSDVESVFDKSPAPITGGAWLKSGDGKWQSQLDWGVKASEMADTLAERLLLAL